jgi:hypothetical protein
MEQLFLLAEKITATLKEKLAIDREQIGIINFDKALVYNSSFEIFFSSKETVIQLNLGVHHLDTPWFVKVFIVKDEEKICLNDNKLLEENGAIAYEVYPNLLRDPNNLGVRLAEEIGDDIYKYLKNKST